MDYNAILQLITQYGTGVVLMAYFLFKDWKFNTHLSSVLVEIKEVLATLKVVKKE